MRCEIAGDNAVFVQRDQRRLVHLDMDAKKSGRSAAVWSLIEYP